jgi:hypothetical protein
MGIRIWQNYANQTESGSTTLATGAQKMDPRDRYLRYCTFLGYPRSDGTNPAVALFGWELPDQFLLLLVMAFLSKFS